MFHVFLKCLMYFHIVENLARKVESVAPGTVAQVKALVKLHGIHGKSAPKANKYIYIYMYAEIVL